MVEMWRGLGHCSGSAVGELQDFHLAAGHSAHYHSRSWSHQRTEERANILLKCHCQQACKRTHKHIHKRQAAHTPEHPLGIYTPTKNMAALCSAITCFGSMETSNWKSKQCLRQHQSCRIVSFKEIRPFQTRDPGFINLFK